MNKLRQIPRRSHQRIIKPGELIMAKRKAGDRYAIGGKSPSLVLDFNKGYYRDGGKTASFEEVCDYLGPSSKTYFDASGIMQTAAPGVARTAHYENGERCLLIEGQAATNLIPNSNDLTTWQNDWSDGSTLVPGAAQGPDGQASLTSVSPNTANGSGTNINCSVTAATQYACSIYVREGTASQFQLRAYDNSNFSPIGDARFNWVGGAPVFASSDKAVDGYAIKDMGDGLYRVSITVTTPAGCTTMAMILYGASTGALSGLTYYGFGQVEAGRYQSSYIHTTGAPVLRAAERLKVLDAIDAAGGSLSADILKYDDSVNFGKCFQIDDGADSTSRVDLYASPSTGDLNTSVNASGASVAFTALETSWRTTRPAFKMSARFGLNDWRATYNGALRNQDNDVAYPSGMNDLAIGSTGTDGSPCAVAIKSFLHWNKANTLTDAELVEASS